MKILALLLLLQVAIFSCSKVNNKNPNLDVKLNEFWWPNKINLTTLRQHSKESSPYNHSYNYAKEFSKVDLKALKKDIHKIMMTSQEWWPADYGNYGPFFIRMAWHSAGTYRTQDGRGGAGGGQQRFEPLNSWPDNANLDKARRLLWPVKKKYGSKLSWADLMIVSGNVALESMGFKTIGFAGGRVDDFEPDLVYWGPENKFMDSDRFTKKGKLAKPLGSTTMGLIYVNPEGPNGNPDPIAAAHQIRETFGNMAMSDEETVALIAGGHTFGKTHGANKPNECIGKEPAASEIENQGIGWKNRCGSGKGIDTITSGLEGAWTSNPTMWTHEYLNNLFKFNWVKTKSSGGSIQWVPDNKKYHDMVVDAHDTSKKHPVVMLTTDLSLKLDPEYSKIAKRFYENPKEFEKAFARAWFKLTHRDMGPISRYVIKDYSAEQFLWQDPLPVAKYKAISSADIDTLKNQIVKSNLTIPELVKVSWASSSSFRSTDMRGGANGARISLEPQKNWQVNNPKELSKVLNVLKNIQLKFNYNNIKSGKKVSLADLVIIAGNSAIERATKEGGFDIKIPFAPGRVDASQDQTDINSFAYLEPKADGFRNYYNKESLLSPVNALIDKAYMLNLTVPEMTALIGGMRVLDTNSDNSKLGIFTKKPGSLSNDFFVNLLDLSTEWKKSGADGIYDGKCRKTKKIKWQATPVDLAFGSSSELRSISEVYASDDGKEKFINDFVKAWVKVTNLDRFDLRK